MEARLDTKLISQVFCINTRNFTNLASGYPHDDAVYYLSTFCEDTHVMFSCLMLQHDHMLKHHMWNSGGSIGYLSDWPL